jgi:hypothetical protein
MGLTWTPRNAYATTIREWYAWRPVLCTDGKKRWLQRVVRVRHHEWDRCGGSWTTTYHPFTYTDAHKAQAEYDYWSKLD